MATKFIEPGGDADFALATITGFWAVISTAPAIVTDFVHGAHKKSIQYRPGNADNLATANATLADAGSRISLYVYFVAFSASAARIFLATRSSGDANRICLAVTTGGVLQLFNGGIQIGTNGSTLSTGTWYRLSLAYTIASGSVNEFRVYKDGVLDISVTNATISTGTNYLRIGNNSGDAVLDFRSSDHYIDNSSSLADPGNIWVTAKRPNANGTTNGFTTQVGSGGSGYGSGHSPQVNERPLSNTNGWSIVGAGSAVTEEYNIESASVGDIDISAATIVDYMGWVDAKTLAQETGNIIVNGTSTAITLTSEKLFKQIAGSTTYPAGTGTDIGIQTDTSLTTVSLYECGIIVAYIPAAATVQNSNFLTFMGPQPQQ